MNKRDVLAMLVSLAFTSAVSLAQAEQGIDPAVSNDEGAAAEAQVAGASHAPSSVVVGPH